ncbi:hypothetical protein SKAU_G00192300 [Synaphobranchus kaupii]|uniref:Uncharacterized protein n=1 Tax=Synaphobranchus kaupii TaxID=118154 RepID=A0A9Q1FDY3_SYNKA|nr:hypothetical protein SKAU_G00192300 [Synaphobranchus kaupii]
MVAKDSSETPEKLHVISNKLQVLLRQVAEDQKVIQERLAQEGETAAAGEPAVNRRPDRRDPSPPPLFLRPGAACGLPSPPPPPAAAHAGLPGPTLGGGKQLRPVQ